MGHHFEMEKLTKFVYEKGKDGELNTTKKFRGVVANFKEFLMESPQKKHNTIEDLMKRFNHQE